MKNISLKTCVAIITFTLGIVLVTLWIKAPNQISVISNIFVVSDETEEYSVYSTVLNELFVNGSEKLLIISDKASHDNSPIKLKPNFNISIEYILIDETKYEDRILIDETNSEQKSNKPDISEFFKEHPGAGGIVRLSRIEFNKEKTEALVEAEFTNCGLCGFGKRISLEKNQGVWKIKKTTDMWIS